MDHNRVFNTTTRRFLIENGQKYTIEETFSLGRVSFAVKKDYNIRISRKVNKLMNINHD